MSDIGITKPSLSWRTVIPFLLSLITLLVFFIYLSQNAAHYKQLFQFSITSLIELVGLGIVTIIWNGLGNYTLYRGFGTILTLNEGIGLAAINSLGNQLPFPAGGLLVTGLYLKKQFSLGYSRFLSAAVAFYILSVTANGLVGTGLLAYWGLAEGIKIPPVLILGFLGMAASLLVLLIPIRSSFIPDPWGKRVGLAFEGWQVVRKNRQLVAKIIFIQLIFMLIYALELHISFHALSQEVTFAQCIIFAAANILTQLISITPDALGVREAIIASIAVLLGFDLGSSIIAVGLIRLVVFPIVATTGALYAYIFSKRALEDKSTLSLKD